jgi:hypothetical protein
MVYLGGDNNLSDEMIWALKEMSRADLCPGCHVLVQFDPSALDFEPRRYDLGKLRRVAQEADVGFDQDGIVEMDLLKETVEPVNGSGANWENSADPGVLADFLHWALGDEFRAEYYMLVLSGHADGATGGLLLDENPAGRLSIEDLRRTIHDVLAMHKRKQINILGLDSCVMSMAEVAHQLAGEVEYMVGAEGFEQNAGWPYHRVLSLFSHTNNNPKAVAGEIVNTYCRYYSDYRAADISADQSCLALGASREFVHAFKDLSDQLVGDLKDREIRKAVVLAHWEAQSYNYEQHTDVWDFCDRLISYLPEKSQILRSRCGAVQRHIEQFVVNSLTSGPANQYSHGISVYFPWSEMSGEYEKLRFSVETGWGAFLQEYITTTCREVRSRNGKKRTPAGALKRHGIYRALEYNQGWYSGAEGIRAGGPNVGRVGGPYVGRVAGLLNVREIARRFSIKNFPLNYEQPGELVSEDLKELEGKLQTLRMQKVFDGASAKAKREFLAEANKALPPPQSKGSAKGAEHKSQR